MQTQTHEDVGCVVSAILEICKWNNGDINEQIF